MQAIEFVTFIFGNDSYDVRRHWKYSIRMKLELSKRRLTASVLTSSPYYIAGRRVRGSAMMNRQSTCFCHFVTTFVFYEEK